MDAAARLVSFSLLLTFSFVLFSYGYSRNVSSRPAVVNVGAIFAFNSSIGRVAKIAIEEAIKDVNADPNILSGTKLVVTMENSDRSGFLGIAGALQFMGTDTVAILGPQSSAISRIVCFAANELQVPLLSFAATDPTLNSLQFPFFVRTTQSDLYQMAAVAEIIYYYDWRQVIAIFVDDDYGRNAVSALGDKLAATARRCKISYKAGIRPDSEVSHDDIMYLLVKVALMESRVVILHVYPKLGLKIFSVAKDLGMMGNGYVWIATDWLSTILDSTSLPSETLDTVQGVLSLRQHTPNSKRKKAFASRWKKLTGASLGLNSYGLYAYDSVWLVAHAIDLFFKQGGVISFSNDSRLLASEGNLHLDALSIFDGGQLLLNNVLQSNFVGLTGPIKFNSDKSRILPAYDIINVIGSGFRQIGYWSNYSGLSVVPPETLYSSPSNHSIENQRLRFAIWPGETMTKPRGWVFPNYGKQLRIGVPIRASFREFVSRVQGTDEFKGFCIDVFTASLNLLPYPVAYQFIPFGDGKKNPSYTELVNSISNGLLDAAIGDIAIVKNRTRIVDFTQPYAASGLVIVAPLRRLNSGAWAFLQPFSARMWIVTSCFFIIIGIVVWILEHRINDEFRGPPRRQVITVLWFSLSTLFFAHRENTVSTLARIVLLIWLSVVLIINSSYTASLTSILTVKQLSSPIKGLETLMTNDERIGYQTGSFAEHYLIEELGFPKSRLVELGSPKAYAEALQKGPDNGGVAAVVDELPYVQLFLSTECDFKIVGEEFTKGGWGFAFPRDSPLADDVSLAILALSENGELQRIHDKWLVSSACNSDSSQVESDRLELKSFWGLYLICAVAFLVSLLIYFIRIMRQSYRATPMESDSPARGSSRSRRLRRVLTLMDEKKLESSSGNKKRKVAKSLSENHVDFVSWRE